MYCGSCMHDNSVAAQLQRMGHEATLIPLYTPLRTDEESVSQERVFYGAVNTYLQVKSSHFSRLPSLLRRWLDRPALLKWVGRFSSSSSARDLGELALAVLEGEEGATHGQLDQLITWLRDELRPEIIHLQNSMFVGLARRLRQDLGVPVVCSLQGEDLFLEGLVEPYRSGAFLVLKERQHDIDAFIANSDYYASHMRALAGLEESRIHRVPLGLHWEDFADSPDRSSVDESSPAPFVVGYLARICPEKGFGLAVEGFCQLAQRVGKDRVRLRIAGYLGAGDRPFFEATMGRVRERGLASSVDVVGEVSRAEKVAFLQSLDVLSVPTIYREPKGIFALEAMACGVPVVVPRHGAFPEMIDSIGGGLLVEPESPEAVAEALKALMEEVELRRELGEKARRGVQKNHGIRATAEGMLDVYRRLLGDSEAESNADVMLGEQNR